MFDATFISKLASYSQTFNQSSMKKIFSLLAIACLFAFIANAQDKKGEFTKEFKLQGFDRLDMGNAFTIDVKPGNFKIVVSGDQDDVEDLEAAVNGGRLRIRYKESNRGWWGKNHHRVYVTITMPTVKGLDFSGATKSTVSGFNDLDVLDLDISGASTSNISVNAKRVNVDVSGASTIILNGKAKDITGEISGATSFRAYDFSVQNADIDVSGASSAKVTVSENLVAEASGASSIRYKGNPRVKMNSSGASSIHSERD